MQNVDGFHLYPSSSFFLLSNSLEQLIIYLYIEIFLSFCQYLLIVERFVIRPFTFKFFNTLQALLICYGDFFDFLLFTSFPSNFTITSSKPWMTFPWIFFSHMLRVFIFSFPNLYLFSYLPAWRISLYRFISQMFPFDYTLHIFFKEHISCSSVPWVS